MNTPALNPQIKSMSLKDITDLLETRHNDAMKVVDKMAESTEFGSVTKISYRTSQGNEYETYALDKRQSVAVAAKLNTALLMRVIDRWQELESQQAITLPNFNNPAEAARAFADEFEAKQKALQLVDDQKKIIETKDNLILASNEASIKAGEILAREFVKSNDLIDLGEHQFYDWMRDQEIVLKGSREPYQKYVKLGYFTWKPSEEMHGGKIRYTLRITPRGKVWLAAKYMAYLDAAGVDALDGNPQPRNGLVLLQGAQA